MVATLTGCEDLGLKSEKFNHQVNDVKKNEFFIIENEKKPAFAYFTIEEDLSHDAKTLLPNEISIPKGKLKIVDDKGDYYGQKLHELRFIK